MRISKPVYTSVCIIAVTPFANGALLFYEPFDYVAGSAIEGQTPLLGAASAWIDTSSGDGTPNSTPVFQPLIVRANGTTGGDQSGQTWTGIPESSTFPNVGGYLEGMRRDNNEGHITLADSVTSQFTDGATIWLSYVSAATTVEGVNDNHHEPTLAIGADVFGGEEVGGNGGDDRARISLNEAVGVGSVFNNALGEIEAMYWDDEATEDVFTQFISDTNVERITPQQLIVARIEFGAENEVITTKVYGLDPFSNPVEAEFEDGAVSITTAENLDQSTFDTLVFDAVRTNLDEIRIATTFEEAISGTGEARAPLAITELVRAEADGAVTITWNSRPGVTYSVDASATLEATDWVELNDTVPANEDGEATTYTERIEDGNGLTVDTLVRFYRVRIAE